MDSRKDEKDLLRKQIKAAKEIFSKTELKQMSDNVFAQLEELPVFTTASNIFIYNSLSDEVQTMDFIQKWNGTKNFFLPVMKGNSLVFREFHLHTTFSKASLNVLEPNGDDFTDYSDVDIVIVPGVAFDTNMNRMGRGKGYYDRFLSQIDVVKIGVCFNFQLFDNIPSDIYDIKMDYIITDNQIIGN